MDTKTALFGIKYNPPTDSSAVPQTLPLWNVAMPVTGAVGWQCPKCGSVYNPKVMGCVKCNPTDKAA